MRTHTQRRRLRVAAALAPLTLVPLTALSAPTASGAAGPDCDSYDTVLKGQYTLIPLKNKAMLTKERCGYRFRAGQQNSHLEVTQHNGGLLFHDTGTASWKSVEAPCEKVSVGQGVAAWCPVPGTTSASNPMLLEIWPRLGSDYIDASTLPAKFQIAALVDAGNDTVHGGAGDDFVNGARGKDKIYGGGGDDWLRSGPQADRIEGGAGADKIIGQGGPDTVDGGAGKDWIGTAGGGDVITGNDGEYDVIKCGPGADQAKSDSADKTRACERVARVAPEPTSDGGSGSDGGGGGTDSGSGGDSGSGSGSSGGGDTGSGGSTPESEWGQRPIAYADPATQEPKEHGPKPGIGPSSPYVQVLNAGNPEPLKDQAIINPVPNGYLYRAGQQDSNLTMSLVNGRLHFVDTGTAAWKHLPPECNALTVPQGVGASCEAPGFFTESRPMLIEVWPRLGDDTIDSTALSARFDISFLADAGNDVAYLGAGDDFVNGAQDADVVYGGGGRDWIRTGLADDFIDGGEGGDWLVGVDNNDTIHGGPGDDLMYGGDGTDQLHNGAGKDTANCGGGVDSAFVLSLDKVTDCESVSRS